MRTNLALSQATRQPVQLVNSSTSKRDKITWEQI